MGIIDGHIKEISKAQYSTYMQMDKALKAKNALEFYDRILGERTFITPKNTDETETSLPSLENLANGYNAMRMFGGEYKKKTKEEILRDGTTLQKMRLLIANIDLNGYFDAKEQLTEAEKARIKTSVRSEKDVELFRTCVRDYDTLFNFSKMLSVFFKRFQASYAVLAVLLNKLDGYEYTAKQLSLTYDIIRTNPFIDIEEEGEIADLRERLYPFGFKETFVNDLITSNVLDGAKLRFNRKEESFYIYPYGKEDSLYTQIKEAAKATTDALSDFKAYAMVAETYIDFSTLYYMPIPIYLCLENVKTERYERYLVKNLRYFRSELNQRKTRGENITPDEERLALIPDFYEVKPTKKVLKDCMSSIKGM